MKRLWILLLAIVTPSVYAEEVIVKLKPGQSIMALSSSVLQNDVRSVANDRFFVVNGNLSEIKNNPAVLYAEPNYKIHVSPIVEETVDSRAWGVEKVSAPKVWSAGYTGKGITVAVIDTGVDYNHSELAGRVIRPTGKEQKDCTGWNFAAKTPDPMDDHNHGTHCAGTIAGKTVGVSPDAKILPVKFISKEGSGTLEDALSAIQYAIDCKVDVMSNSWGGGDSVQSLQEVITEAHNKNIVFIAAAGNDSNDNDLKPTFPSNYDHVISVAATTQSDAKAFFSNYGEKTVLVAAPGDKIYSSVIGDKYAAYSGTSMATPHVAGIVALMLEAKIPASEVAKKLEVSADQVSADLKVKAKGRINAFKAIQ